MRDMTSREILDAFDHGLAEARRPFELNRELALGAKRSLEPNSDRASATLAEDGAVFDRSA